MTDIALSAEQIESFVEDGYVLERAVLPVLGVDRLDHRPAAPREDVRPERVRRQQRMREEEEARLAEAAS